MFKRIIQKILNKKGYYKLASSRYYTSTENNQQVLVDRKKFSEKHPFNRHAVEEATKQLLKAMGQDTKRPRIVRNT